MVIEDRLTKKELLENYLRDKKKLEKFVDDTISRNRTKIYRALIKDNKGKPLKLKTRSVLIENTRYYATVTIWHNKKDKVLSWNEVFYSISLNRAGKKIIIQYQYKDITDQTSGAISGITGLNISTSGHVIIYENHLLNRYRERYLGLGPGEISFEDLAEKFMSGRENESSVISFLSNNVTKEGCLELEARRNDGVYFGIMEPSGKIRYLTYITEEMATREGQDFIRDEARKQLEDLYEVMKDFNLLAPEHDIRRNDRN